MAIAELMTSPPVRLPCALDRILELAIPKELLGHAAGEPLRLSLALLEGTEPLEQYPSEGTFELVGSLAESERSAWSV